MGKLFAFEDQDNTDVVSELETTPEVGEVANVQADFEGEASGIAELGDAVEEGVDASGQMEEVEALVEQAAEEGEGLDPIAAEAIRIAVESICQRVGAQPKTFYSLYATENFQSASSRKANTRIALEGVGEFLKDLWKKIKAALDNLWTKIKAFWDKHVSSLGRIKKALESAKSKVAASSGKIEGQAYLEKAPSGLVSAFGFKKNITAATIKDVIATHKKGGDSVDEVNEAITSLNTAAAGVKEVDNQALGKTIGTMFGTTSKTIEVGTESAPLVGGNYISFKFEPNKEEGNIVVEVERNKTEVGTDVDVQLVEKAVLQDMLKQTLDIINETIKVKEKNDKLEQAVNKFMTAINLRINELSTEAKPESMKAVRNIMKVVYKVNAKLPSINAEIVGLNIGLAKAVLGYAGLCLKHYK